MMIRGLTLYQPMAWAISDFTKRIENRSWKPWAGVTHLAIHAGMKFHQDHVDQILEVFGREVPPKDELPYGRIVAVARLAGYVEASDDPWFSGPYGWLLEDVRKLVEPIRCKGSLGLWKLPGDLDQHILDLPAVA